MIMGGAANGAWLVVPKVDDCIAIFLGSKDAYTTQIRAEPGTYYLTKSWIEVGDTPFSEHEYSVERYGEEKANRIFKMMMGNYTRLALINTGQYKIENIAITQERHRTSLTCGMKKLMAQMLW